LVTIDKTVPGDKGEINALIKGIEIVKVLSFTKQDSWFEAKVEVIKETVIEDDEVKAIIRYISTQIKKAINLGKTVDFVFLMNILNTDNPINFAHQIAVVLDLKPQERQMLLEEMDLKTNDYIIFLLLIVVIGVLFFMAYSLFQDEGKCKP